ncbi:hypothetical protein FUA26_04045 [Seonamhaeicola algicola]|uniref:Anti-sigma factor n=1 Tax=Seonamhaeicola algicola TaxID=1719036 RepID=A0A5C7AZ41_9FLAO|nr:hypothetical protein [Seonamhaeicola algicola]TXE12973.1 hypothetical protein FUA26_04045 [Seonamhaeicola algicola]
MSNKFEKYVEKHKLEFDVHTIDEASKLRLWGQIAPQLTKPTPKVIPLWQKPVFKVAATIVLLMGCTLFFTLYTSNINQNTIVNNELYDIDNHYKVLVNNQITLIKHNTHLTEEDRTEFLTLIDDLDQEYNKLKKELTLGINNQKIIEAIISNYRKKIKLMEDLLNRSYPINDTIDDEAITL